MGFRNFTDRSPQVVTMRLQRGAAIRSDALAGEVQTGVRPVAVRGEIEGKQPARHRFFLKTKLAMDAAESVLLQKQARAVRLLPQVATASELDRDRLAELLLPALLGESVQIFVS